MNQLSLAGLLERRDGVRPGLVGLLATAHPLAAAGALGGVDHDLVELTAVGLGAPTEGGVGRVEALPAPGAEVALTRVGGVAVGAVLGGERGGWLLGSSQLLGLRRLLGRGLLRGGLLGLRRLLGRGLLRGGLLGLRRLGATATTTAVGLVRARLGRLIAHLLAPLGANGHHGLVVRRRLLLVLLGALEVFELAAHRREVVGHVLDEVGVNDQVVDVGDEVALVGVVEEQ